MKIKSLHARFILDSRGYPAVECILTDQEGRMVAASVPSGASVGVHEALELRDGDPKHFAGKGVSKAINNLNIEIAKALCGREADVIQLDKILIALDGTENKSRLGANAILAASMAVIRLQALDAGLELFECINKLWHFPEPKLPTCLFNVINGGMHASSGLWVQEFMIIPKQQVFSQSLETACVIYHALHKKLKVMGLQTTIGDEGGFAPVFGLRGLENEHRALDVLIEIIKQERLENFVTLGLDVAASHSFDKQTGQYQVYDKSLSSTDLIAFYQKAQHSYPLTSIEDGLGEDDWDGWKKLTQAMGVSCQLVADDLFVTNPKRIEQGIVQKVANAVLIKPNQIGTVSQTMQAILCCQKAGYSVIISHRSGETNDTFIADLAVGSSAGQLKAGAPARGERIAKYNRLLEIEGALHKKGKGEVV